MYNKDGHKVDLEREYRYDNIGMLIIMKVLGYEFKKGEYQGHSFDNTILYLAYPIARDGNGYKVDKCKCKTEIITSFLDSNQWEFDNLINIDIIVYYDKYGNIIDISRK